MIRMSRLK